MNELPLLADKDGSDDWISWTTQKQGLASDPAGSAWVSANAGSGKTHVLTQRVIRLMLAGSRPSAILCLTYTKAAASEMSNRVFERLADWATMPDLSLAAEITRIEGKAPTIEKLNEARRLFARALETPGGLKIQTIHAFSEALLHQFPLEANVAGHFSVLDDTAAAALLAQARRALLTATTSEDDPELANAFAHVLELADDTGLDRLITEIIANRTALQNFIHQAKRKNGIEQALRDAFGIPANETMEAIHQAFWPLPGFKGEQLAAYFALAEASGGDIVKQTLAVLTQAASEPDCTRRAGLLTQAFFTAKDEPRAARSFYNSLMIKQNAALAELISSTQEHLKALLDRLAIFRMFEATCSAMVLAERLNDDYEDLKKQRSLLDFEDLIERTAALLQKSEIGPWVHYKLDQGIDHILVDEAQDTSPTQWSIIKSLAEDFFTGQSARTLVRTFFAVGDEKQSIYSFLGARPERFAEERSRTKIQIEASGARFHPIQLPLSFRSTQDVLAAVDQVYANPSHAKGLNAEAEAIVHMSSRIGQAGAVDLWEMIVPPKNPGEDRDWTSPFDALLEKAPASQLAQRIAASIEAMVGQQTIFTKDGPRRIEAGDILVLVRKRDAFVSALTRTLKSRGNIPVAGADRLVLASHIAVQDLMALGRFVLLPEDDLSLAALMKSPLFGLSEDDVFTLAANRMAGASVWQHLIHLAVDDERFKAVHARLARWIALSRSLRVHDFYAHVLGADGGRRAYLGRLGNEVSDILDEFLIFALTHETNALPGLQSFIATLESDPPTVKREQDKGRNEVRIMTVHAAKGLEAPVVFLVEGGGAAFNQTHVPKLRLLKCEGSVDVPAWMVSKEFSNSLKTKDDLRLKAEAEAEYRRLLYVGMTRAADRLIICGYRGQKIFPDTWHQMATTALTADVARCTPKEFQAGNLIWQGHEWRVGLHDNDRSSFSDEPLEATRPSVPDALFSALPARQRLPRPLSPSGAHAIIEGDDGDLIVGSSLFGTAGGVRQPALRGKIIHRLLQVLPGFGLGERRAIAARYVERAAPYWPEAMRHALLDMIFSVFEHAQIAALFNTQGQAEVTIMGTIQLGDRPHAITGRVDRISITEDSVFIADFKTNRIPPRSFEEIPAAHITQLALYREVLKPLYPGKNLRCVLIYTEEPRMIELTVVQLDESLDRLSTY